MHPYLSSANENMRIPGANERKMQDAHHSKDLTRSLGDASKTPSLNTVLTEATLPSEIALMGRASSR